jgi:hypothetical protein
MRRSLTFLLIISCLFPLTASAQTATSTEAGFIPNPIWFSKDRFYAGETVKISTVIHNDLQNTITGSLVFLDGKNQIGTTDFSLAPSAIKPLSINWRARAGAHEIRAQIENAQKINADGTKTAIELSQSQTASTRKIVEADPAQTADPKSVLENSEAGAAFGQAGTLIQNALATLEEKLPPVVTETASKIGEAIETWRTDTGKVLGESTKKAESSKAATSTNGLEIGNLAATISLGAQKVLAFIFQNAIAFYLVAVTLFFFGCRFAYKKMTRRPFEEEFGY